MAAAREDTPSLARMFCMCRATVCSLRCSAPAMSRLFFPAATNRSTWTSRSVSTRWRCAPLLEQGSGVTRVGGGAEPLKPSPGGVDLDPPALLVA